MNSTQLSDIDTLASLAAFVLIQTTAVLAVGLLFARAFRRRGVAVQSAWYRIILAAAMLAPCAWPAIGLVVTRVHIPIPLPDRPRPISSVPIGATVPAANRQLPMAELPSTNMLTRGDRPPVVPPNAEISPAAASDRFVNSDQPARAASASAAAGSSWFNVAVVMFYVLWLLVSALLIGRLSRSILGAMRLIRTAADPEPQDAARLRQLAVELRAGASDLAQPVRDGRVRIRLATPCDPAIRHGFRNR